MSNPPVEPILIPREPTVFNVPALGGFWIANVGYIGTLEKAKRITFSVKCLRGILKRE